MAGKYDISCDQNGRVTRTFDIATNDEPDDLTGYKARMFVRKTHDAASPKLIDFSTENGALEVDPVVVGRVALDAAVPAEIGPGAYVYDLFLIDAASHAEKLLEGRFIVTASVTDPGAAP